MGNKYSKATNSISDASNSFESYRFPLVDLEEATNNFDDKFFIGESGLGKVYRGVLRDGTKVALKRHNRDFLDHVIASASAFVLAVDKSSIS